MITAAAKKEQLKISQTMGIVVRLVQTVVGNTDDWLGVDCAMASTIDDIPGI